MENGKNNLEQERNKNELKFCKTHNNLYVRKCNYQLKGQEIGQNDNCDICLLKDIEEEKRKKLKENIKALEFLMNHLQDNKDKLNKISEIINDNKEDLKFKIQKIFTKIRSAVNDREEILLAEVDNAFDEIISRKDFIKESESLPNKIKKSLDKAKTVDNQWNNKELSDLIKDCLNIEKNFKEINLVNDKMNRFNLREIENTKLKFNPAENELDYVMKEISRFGKISFDEFSIKKCTTNISEDRKYLVTGEKQNIFIKVGSDYSWMGCICEKPLDLSKDEYKWKIKILKTYNYNIMVGVANIDFDINYSSYDINKNCGWYYYFINGALYSGPPSNYQGKRTNLIPRSNEITVIMNMKKKSLTFKNDKDKKEDSFNDILLDKPLFPSILLRDIFDTVEITEI